VGKTTIGRAVAAALGFVFLPEAATLARPSPTLEFGSPGELLAIELELLASERRRAGAVRRLRRDGVDVLLDTSPVGPATYTMGVARLRPEYRTVAERVVDEVTRDLRAERLPTPERVLYLDAGRSTLRRRAAAARGSHPAELTRRHWAVAEFERGFWTALGSGRPEAVRAVAATGALPTASRRVAREIRRPGPPLRVGPLVRALDSARGLPGHPRIGNR
jgi:hypothetical protein